MNDVNTVVAATKTEPTTWVMNSDEDNGFKGLQLYIYIYKHTYGDAWIFANPTDINNYRVLKLLYIPGRVFA